MLSLCKTLSPIVFSEIYTLTIWNDINILSKKYVLELIYIEREREIDDQTSLTVFIYPCIFH